MKLGNFWLIFGIVGIIGAVIPAAAMSTEIFFDLNFFLLIVGIGTFYVIGSGGSKLQMIDNFGKGAQAAGALGFFIALASLPSKEGQEAVELTQYAVFSICFGTIVGLISQVIFNRLSNKVEPL